MTDPKVTFLEKSAIVKTQLQILAESTADAQANTSNITDRVIDQWRAEGVLTDEDIVTIRQNIPVPDTQPLNIQAMVDMIGAMEQIVEQMGSNSGFSLSEVATQPASTTAPGNPGQFYIQAGSLFWLCVRTNFWVKLSMG